MAYSVLTAKSELEPMMHGTTLNQVGNINGAFNRAARQLLLDIDPQETKRSAPLSSPVFNGVYDYIAPTDLKGNKVIDIYPPLTRNPMVSFGQTYNKPFDITKDWLINEFTVITTSGDKYLRISLADQSNSIIINNDDSVSGNGTWGVSGTASGITVDQMYQPNVLQFNVATGVGSVANSTMEAIDLSAQEDQSTIFFDIYLPDASALTSVSVQFGSDTSDYYELTNITTNFNGLPFSNGWNTIAVPWNQTTTVGSPNSSSIAYVQASFTASSTITAMKMNSVWSRIGYVMNIEYYSRYLFRTTAGVWQETVTDDSNLINLDTESYNLFLYQVAYQCVQQALGQNVSYDTELMLTKYAEGLARYKRMYKSEISQAQQPYYVMNNNRRYLNNLGNVQSYP